MAISKMEKQEKTCGRKISGRMFFREYPVAFFCLSLLKKKIPNGVFVSEKSLACFFFSKQIFTVFSIIRLNGRVGKQ